MFFSISAASFAQPIDVVNNLAGTNGETVGLVGCATSKEDRPCTLDDLIITMSKTASFIITIILPVVFFYGLFMTLWPVFKGPDNPVNIAEAKSRFIKLLIGTAVVAGAYLIVKGALVSIGVKETDTIKKVINTKTSFRSTGEINYLAFIFDKANAQGYSQAQDSQAANTGSEPTIYSQAQDSQAASGGSFQNPLENVTVQGVIGGIINSVIFIAILGNIYMYFRAAFLFLNGQQNPSNLIKARWWLGAGVAVTLIVFGAQTLYGIIEGTIKSVFTT